MKRDPVPHGTINGVPIIGPKNEHLYRGPLPGIEGKVYPHTSIEITLKGGKGDVSRQFSGEWVDALHRPEPPEPVPFTMSKRTRWTLVREDDGRDTTGPAVRYCLTTLFLAMGFKWHRGLMFEAKPDEPAIMLGGRRLPGPNIVIGGKP